MAAASPYGGLYPSLEDEYMGLQLTQYRTVSGTGIEAQIYIYIEASKMTDQVFIFVGSTSITMCACDQHVIVM